MTNILDVYPFGTSVEMYSSLLIGISGRHQPSHIFIHFAFKFTILWIWDPLPQSGTRYLSRSQVHQLKILSRDVNDSRLHSCTIRAAPPPPHPKRGGAAGQPINPTTTFFVLTYFTISPALNIDLMLLKWAWAEGIHVGFQAAPIDRNERLAAENKAARKPEIKQSRLLHQRTFPTL